jgi:hypothetical protein
MAADLNLHRCITKMPHLKRECYERTRLYFLVYICDHHCSLIYGKPPMTREFRTLRSPKAFLQSEFCTSDDIKLISQVDLWGISSRVFDIFGADIEASITSERIAELDTLSRTYDICRSTILGAIPIDPGDGFPRQLYDLYVHCAKLSLFSLIFRGSSQRCARPSPNPNGMEKFEKSALASALAIVQSVSWGREIQQHLEMLPTYFGTMIAFASVSLLKFWNKEPSMTYFDKKEVAVTLNRLVEVFSAASARVQPGHPLRSVSKSLKMAMDEYCQPVDPCDLAYTPEALNNAMFGFDDFGGSFMETEYSEAYNGLSSQLAPEFHSDFSGFQSL